MTIMIIKSSAWTLEDFETSLHPEYAAIRGFVRSFRSNFALVGIGGGAYQRFHHSTFDVTFYNIPDSNPIFWLLAYPMVLALVVAVRPKVLFTMGMFVQIPAQLGADLVGARHVTALIGEPFYLPSRMRLFSKVVRLHFFLRISLRRVRAAVAISEKARRDIEKILGGGPPQIGLYHYTLPDIFHPDLTATLKVGKPLRGPIVLTSCRFERRKGLEVVILAASLVVHMIPNVTFVIRGPISDANYFGELREMIRKKGLGEQVVLAGETRSYEDLPGILASADVFLHPSRDESLGLAIAEALACGVPVVATRVGGIPELVEHMGNGLLVEPNAESVSNAIVTILTDTELRERLKDGARRFSYCVRKPKNSDFARVFEMRIREALWA